MKVLIVGGGGQVGRALAAHATSGATIVSLDRGCLDITDPVRVEAAVRGMTPDLVFNAAAYTSVDKAEGDEAAAHAVNALAVGLLSRAAREAGARFVHISTDFVFDGLASMPYLPDAPPNPLSAYGRTKRAGEVAAGEDALVVRTGWVYAPLGVNFVSTMLRLMRDRSEVRVVADQVGTPTDAAGLAAALWVLAGRGLNGIYHYTDSGVASWYDFAVAIQEEALAAGLLTKPALVIPIRTDEFPTAARRPSYSVLDKRFTFAALGEASPHWRTKLRSTLAAVKTYV